MVPAATTLSTLSPAFSALDCMELSNCHATHRFTITPATYCPQHRRFWTLVDHLRFQDFLVVACSNKKSFSEVLSIFLLVYYWHFFQLTEVPLRVQLYVDMYPDDTRTVFMSPVSMFTGVGMLVLRAEV